MVQDGAVSLVWERVVAEFAGRRVMVIGDVMLDEYISGDARRVCPEAPVPVVEAARRWVIPGGAANAATNVAALAASPVLAGAVGNDAYGEELVRVCRTLGVDASGFVVAPDRPTTVKLRVLARNQQVLRIDTESAVPLPQGPAELLAGWAERIVSEVDAVLVSDYGKGALTEATVRRTIRAARANGRPVVVDPRGTDLDRYAGATVIKPNLTELAELSGRSVGSSGAARDAGQRLADQLPGTAILVTRGAEGMALFRSGERPVSLPASPARKVFDVTGAGDTVAAVLTLALAGRVQLESAIQLANVAAGIVVGKVGTASVSATELLSALDEGVPEFANELA